MSDPTRKDSEKIIDAVDMAFDEQLKFTQQLVRFRSLRGAENPAQDFILAAMIERGFETDRWRLDVDAMKDHPGFGPVDVSYAEAYNVVGSYRPKHLVGRSLILNGHIDVVPTGPPEMWARSPWEPAIIDGWMFGRGAADMKAGLAANFFAYDAVRAAGYTPTAPIYFQSVVEEECTGNGALSALLRGYTADAVIIPEPEENMLVRANVGVVWFKVRVDGRPAHTREMNSGFNAIDAAFRLIGALRELESVWNAQRHRHAHFEHLEHPINFNVGKIVGGDWPSTVPAWCEFDVRIALYPGVSADEGRAHIERCIRDAAAGDPNFGGVQPTVRFHGFYSAGYVLEPGSDAENVLRACHGRVFDEELAAFTTPGYLDARVFALYGGIPSLVYGPKSLNIHAYDERVHLDSLRKITKTIALFIAHWCGIA